MRWSCHPAIRGLNLRAPEVFCARRMELELIEIVRTEILDTAEPLTPQSDLFAAGLDSMGIMQLLLAIEDKFGVMIDPADLSRENFSTGEKIAALVAGKQASASR